MIESLNFLYYVYPYQWQVNPESLQKFIDQVDYLCSLENREKISSQEAYNQIKLALTELEFSENN